MNTADLPHTSHTPPTAAGHDLVAPAALAARSARTSLRHRIAMRIGLWLLMWGTRPAEVAESAPAQAEARRANTAARIADAARAEHELALARAGVLHGMPHRFIR